MVECTEQESIPNVSTLTNQKPTPKQNELNVATGVEKDKLFTFSQKARPWILYSGR